MASRSTDLGFGGVGSVGYQDLGRLEYVELLNYLAIELRVVDLAQEGFASVDVETGDANRGWEAAGFAHDADSSTIAYSGGRPAPRDTFEANGASTAMSRAAATGPAHVRRRSCGCSG